MDIGFRFPPMHEAVLGSGMRVIWLPDSEQPVLDLLLQVESGRILEPVGLEGCAELCANVMQKGPAMCTHEQYVDAMEQVGASQIVDVGEEHTTFGVRCLYRWSGDVVGRFWEMVTNPALEEHEFARVKKEMLTALEAEYADPGSLAAKHFQAELYGRGHSLGRIASPATVRRITLEDLRAFYNRYTVPGGACAVVAGDDTVENFHQRWEGLLGSWQSGMCTVRGGDGTHGPETSSTRIRLVDKPDSSQTTLAIGHCAVCEGHPSRNALALANHIFGGGDFSSRLMAEVRTRTGKTYGIASQLVCNRAAGTFLVTTTTQNQQVGEVIKAVCTVYRDLVENGVGEEELEKAKQFAIGNLAFQLEGVGNVAEKLLWLRFYGYDNSFIENFSSTISAIDREQVNRALKQDFASPGFVITAVGKKSEVLRQLEAFGGVSVVGFRSDP